MVEFDGAWMSRGQFKRVVDALDEALDSIAIGTGHRVGVLLRNHPEALAAMICVIATERCLVAVNPTLPDHKLAADIAQLALPVIVAPVGELDRAGVMAALAAAGTRVLEIGPSDRIVIHPSVGDATRVEERAPGIMIEMLTSGTTGSPKRISLSTAAFDRSFASALSYEKGRSAEDVARARDGTRILANPIAHIGGLWGAISAIAGGWRVCLLDKFSVDQWRGAIVRHRPKIAAAVPAGLRMILDANVPREDLASLVAIRTGTAPLDPAIVEAFLDRYDLPVLQTYGATEFAGAVAGWTLKAFRAHYRDKVGSVGRLQPGVSARTVDPVTGEVLPAGAEGLLQLRSAQLGDPDAWVTTTDRAVIDDEAYLWVKGRSDNAIIRGGFKIHPDDIVQALESHPAVREACVVGVADERLGEVPVAAVVARADARSLTADELRTHLRGSLMAYQIPTSILIVDDLPRTTSMKPDSAAVRRLFSGTSEGA